MWKWKIWQSSAYLSNVGEQLLILVWRPSGQGTGCMLFVKQGVLCYCRSCVRAGGHVSLCTRGQGHYCFQTNSRRDVISVNSGICFFSLSSSLLSLGTWDQVFVCTGTCVAGGQFWFTCVLSWIDILQGVFWLHARGLYGFGCDRYVLVLGWPRRENKQSASPKV